MVRSEGADEGKRDPPLEERSGGVREITKPRKEGKGGGEADSTSVHVAFGEDRVGDKSGRERSDRCGYSEEGRWVLNAFMKYVRKSLAYPI